VAKVFSGFFLTLCCACAALPQKKVLDEKSFRTSLQEQFAERRSLSADTVLRLKTPENNIQQNGSVVLSQSGQMRLDIRGPHGGVLLVLVVDGNNISFLDLHGGRYVESTMGNQQITQVFPFLPLLSLGQQWGELLLGNIQPAKGAKFQALESGQGLWIWEEMNQVSKVVKADSGAHIWTQEKERLEHHLQAETQGQKILSYRVFSKGDELLKIDYEKWRSDGFVGEMKIVLPRRDTILDLSFRDVQKNLDFSPDIFKLKAPKGVEKEIW